MAICMNCAKKRNKKVGPEKRLKEKGLAVDWLKLCHRV